MRIISGKLGGRQFAAPHGHRTHPMADKVRGALFNALGDLDGLIVLDAFGGSGALAFEAVSRGADNAVAIDSDRNAQLAIADNIAALGLANQVKLIKASANAWLGTTDDNFDLVLLDPPYDDPQPGLLERLAERVKSEGVLVVSLKPGTNLRLDKAFEELARKNYGDAELAFYRRSS